MKIAFLGGGNMASALIGGLIAKGHDASRISVVEMSPAAREKLGARYPVRVTTAPDDAMKGADTLVLAVKPQDMATTVRVLAPGLARRRPLVLSIAAGIRVADIQGWCGPGIAVVRAMPNRPALNNAGASALYAPAGLTPEQRKLAEDALAAVGTAVWVNEEDALDVVTALSGSGPAYFFLLAELMTDAAVHLGLARESAQELAIQTLFGSGRMARDSDGDLARLRAEVTSKGGTTEAALRVFDSSNLRGIVAAALQAATDRGRELAQAFGSKTT